MVYRKIHSYESFTKLSKINNFGETLAINQQKKAVHIHRTTPLEFVNLLGQITYFLYMI